MMTAAHSGGSGWPRIVTGAVVALLLLHSAALAGEAAESAGASAPAPAARLGITTLEQFLDRALRVHPEILAAEAKVASANAELSRARFQIARELIALWNGWRVQSADIQTLERYADRGFAETRDLIEAKGTLAEIEAQLSYLLGQASGPTTLRAAAPLPAAPKQAPSGPLADKIHEALNQPAEISFSGAAPVRAVAEIISRHHEIRVVVDPAVADLPVTLEDTHSIPLGAALQEAEVFTPGIRFVVCDFGLLVTSDTSAAAATFISANEFWKESAGKEALERQREHFLRALRGASPASSPAKPFGGRGGAPGGGKKPPSDAGEPKPSPGDPFAPSPGGPSAPSPRDPFAPSPGDPSAPSPRDPFAPSPGGPSAPSPRNPFAPSPRPIPDGDNSQPAQEAGGRSSGDPFAAPPPADD